MPILNRNLVGGLLLLCGGLPWAAHAATACAVQTEIPQSECESLLDFWNSTDAPNWEGWGVTNTPCSWAGVTCLDGHVTTLDRSGKYLFGKLPALALPALQVLNLSDNLLFGSVPEPSSLPALRGLYLQNNRLSGPLPDFSGLPDLEALNLRGNQLDGLIANFSDLPVLRQLYLGSNHLDDPVPDFSGLPALEELDLSSNGLSGPVPDFSRLPTLKTLYLSANQLNAVPDFSGLPLLEELYLGGNPLDGPVPEFSGLPSLIKLHLYGSQLSGPVPDFRGLSALKSLILSDNQLDGPVPDFSGLPALEQLSLEYNQLSGPLPDFSGLPALQGLHLNDNQLSGPLPDFSGLPALQDLHLHDNQLDGPVPDFSNLPALRGLVLDYNQLDGPVPDFSGLPLLKTLVLGNNQLDGPVPDFSNLPLLKTLGLNNNQLDGPVPDFSGLAALEELRLYDNQLNGPVPNFSRLPALKSLGLSNNQLDGPVPEFSGLPVLRELFLSGNRLSGTLPAFSGSPLLFFVDIDAPWLSYVNFDYNAFTGETDGDASRLQWGWEKTQTVPPTDVSASASGFDRVQLSWTPISYTQQGGYYQVSYATSPGGPYTVFGTRTANTTATGLEVTGLDPSTAYYFVVRTHTPAHASNSNALTSIASAEVAATTLAARRLSVDTDGSGSGTVGGGGVFTYNTPVTPTASADPGSRFSGWTPASCGAAFTLTTDTLCVATFTPAPGGGPGIGGVSPSLEGLLETAPGLVSARVNEAAGTLSVSLGRGTDSVGPIVLAYTSVDGDARAGSDYQPVSGSLSWADGDNSDKEILLSLLDDSEYEGEESFRLRLSVVSGNASLSHPDLELLIVDNDPQPPACLVNSGALNLETGDAVTSAACFDSRLNTGLGRVGNGQMVLQHETVNLALRITTDRAHHGQAAKLLLLLNYQHAGHTTWLARSITGWRFWREGETLPAAQDLAALPETLGVLVYSGSLTGLPGVFTVYAGYLLNDGTLVHNLSQPLRVTVANALVAGTDGNQAPAYAYFDPGSGSVAGGGYVHIHTPALSAGQEGGPTRQEVRPGDFVEVPADYRAEVYALRVLITPDGLEYLGQSGQDWVAWLPETGLPSAAARMALGQAYRLNLYPGASPSVGEYTDYVGYRLPDGGIVYNGLGLSRARLE